MTGLLRRASRATFAARLMMIVTVAAGWRLLLLQRKWHRPLMLNDSIYYSIQAVGLTQGRGYGQLTPQLVWQRGAEHGPLTSTLMAAVSWVDNPVPWQRVVTTVCGIVAVAVIGYVGRRLAGDRAGLAAAGLAAVYPNLWISDGLVMSESISTLMIATWLLVTLRFMRQPSWRHGAVVGALVGLATLTRSELILLLPLVVVWCWFVLRGHAARVGAILAIVAAAVVTLSPWVIHNMTRFERPVTLSTNGGNTLAGSYCDPAFYGSGTGGWSILCLAPDPADDGRTPEPSVQSARRRSLAVSYLRSHLGEMPRVELARLGRLLDLYGLHDLVFQDVGEERPRWASWAGIVSFWICAPLAVLGLRRLDRQDRWLLLLPVVVVVAVTLIFYGAHRIRSSLEPTLVLAAALWLAQLGRSAGESSAGAWSPTSVEPISSTTASNAGR